MLVSRLMGAVLPIVGALAANYNLTAPIRITFYKSADCLTLDVFPPTDSLTLMCDQHISDSQGMTIQSSKGYPTHLLDSIVVMEDTEKCDFATDSKKVGPKQKTYKLPTTSYKKENCKKISQETNTDDSVFTLQSGKINAIQCVYKSKKIH